MNAKRCIGGTLILALISGCATTKDRFYADRAGASNAQICRTLSSSAVQADAEFHRELRNELNSRGVSESECANIVKQQNMAIGAGVVLGAALIAAAASGGGGGYASGGYTPVSDYQWDWDQFYGSAGGLVWICRGVQTTQFADLWRCAGKPQTDFRWPAK